MRVVKTRVKRSRIDKFFIFIFLYAQCTKIRKRVLPLCSFNLFKQLIMKRRIFLLISIYFIFILIFALQKPMFMIYYQELFDHETLWEWFKVMIHGLPLDFSFAGYLTIIPGLIIIASTWWDNRKLLKRIFLIYFLIVFLHIFTFLIIP